VRHRLTPGVATDQDAVLELDAWQIELIRLQLERRLTRHTLLDDDPLLVAAVFDHVVELVHHLDARHLVEMRPTERRLIGRQVVFQADEEVLGHLRFDVIGPGPQGIFAERLHDAVHRALVAQCADGTLHAPGKLGIRREQNGQDISGRVKPRRHRPADDLTGDEPAIG
jgi:hypothetical protein